MLPPNLPLEIQTDFELADGSRTVKTVFSCFGGLPLDGYSVVAIADSILSSKPLDFFDPARVIAHGSSLGPNRITTLVVRFPRLILSELNTHRVFSRNSASSRARSIKVVVTDVMESPYVPLFTENQRGMSGPLVDAATQERATVQWLAARDSSVASVLSMLTGKNVPVDTLTDTWRELLDNYYQQVYLEKQAIPGSLNLHKQNVNRLLEPYMWHEAVITSTEWNNFLELRDHNDADPAIHALAKLVRATLETSRPITRVVHAPFASHIADSDPIGLNEVSHGALFSGLQLANYTAGAAAQVSYRPVQDGGTGADPAKLAIRLLSVKHLSPFEHAAFSADWLYALGLRNPYGSNLSSEWVQHRALLAQLQELFGETDLEAIMARISGK